MSDFNSLTFALEEWFDKPLSDIPGKVQKLIKQDFSPMPWDDLHPDQRRSVALQLDYQHDPDTDEERQYWSDFFWRKDALEKKIAEWRAIATPTASDLAQKEARLDELKKELARMEHQGLQSQGDYYPKRDQSNLRPNYIAYPLAMSSLAERLKATPEELSAWIFLSTKDEGLFAYTNANELDPPPRFYFCSLNPQEDYLSPLMSCWFVEEDVANFQPTERFITGKALIERWSKQPHIKPITFIIAKIQESRLHDIHPTFGLTCGSTGEDSSPPIESGLFSLTEVRDIEAKDFSVIYSEAPQREEENSDKPWLIHNPNDPSPEYPWYTPARYFARKLVIEDSTLLVKRDLLAKKVADMLKSAGILKRGGKKPLDSSTVKKAFSNVILG